MTGPHVYPFAVASREPSPDELAGFEAFWIGARHPQDLHSPDFRIGYEVAARRAYGAGVKASLQIGGEINCPFAQFSPAWECWADGYIEETGL